MPGPYAHITLLYELMRSDRLVPIFSSSSGFVAALEAFFPHCALGSVSPDYPNLAKENGSASKWADAMHCTRACEMNQDSYIYRRMDLGEIGDSDMFALAVVQCSNSDDRTQLDRDIVTLWQGMLADVQPDLFIAHHPDSASWHREFVARVSGCASGKVRHFPLAGVIAAKMELAYPSFGAVDLQFVEEQLVPSEKSRYLHYDDIFYHAACNVIAVWKQVERAVCAVESTTLSKFGIWNLDNRRDESGRLIFWD